MKARHARRVLDHHNDMHNAERHEKPRFVQRTGSVEVRDDLLRRVLDTSVGAGIHTIGGYTHINDFLRGWTSRALADTALETGQDSARNSLGRARNELTSSSYYRLQHRHASPSCGFHSRGRSLADHTMVRWEGVSVCATPGSAEDWYSSPFDRGRMSAHVPCRHHTPGPSSHLSP